MMLSETQEVGFSGINIPKSGVSLRRTKATAAIPMNWGRDESGRYLFLLELDGDHRDAVHSRWTSVKGIEVALHALDEGHQGLALILQRESDLDLFTDLCMTLISRLSAARDSATAVVICLEHVKRWKAFLAGTRSRVLDTESILGLIGELAFLKKLATHLGDPVGAVDAWRGPLGSQHDFVLPGVSYEIKAVGQSSRGAVRISSEDQLECLAGELYLRVYKVSETPGEEGLSLNDLVGELESTLGDDANEILINRLALAGYVDSKDYDLPRYIVKGCHTYTVAEGFPRIARTTLPDGVSSVTYNIQISALREFECATDPLEEG